MAKELTFECIVHLTTGERIENAFYGVDYAEARERADRYLVDYAEYATEVVFECEL